MNIVTIEPYPNYHFRSIINKLKSRHQVKQVAFEDVPSFRKGEDWEKNSSSRGLFATIKSIFKNDVPIFLGILSPAPKMLLLFILACIVKRDVYVASEGLKTPKRPNLLTRSIFRFLTCLTNIHFLCIGKNANKDYARLGFEQATFRKFAFSEDYQNYSNQSFEAELEKYDSRECHLLLAGRLIERKNFSSVLSACANLTNSDSVNRKLVLHIAGEGPEHDELVRICQQAPQLTYYFHGHVDKAKLALLYKQAHLFVLPSLYEGWGVVVNNAIHYGLPCICFDTVRSAKGFLVEDNKNGFVITAGNCESAIEKFSNLPTYEMKNMARSAYQHAQLWSTDNIAEQFEALLLKKTNKIPDNGPLSYYPISENLDV